jgi:hypothetical protein
MLPSSPKFDPCSEAMRRITTAYAVLSIWFFGWLTATFGILPALLAAIIFASPAVFSWRMTTRNRPTRRREYLYLGILTALAAVSTSFIVVKWFETGMDRLTIFDREYRAFRSHIASMPEYKDVEVSYTNRKGGRLYLHGTVGTKDSHDQLIQLVSRMVRNNESGYYDGVEYPGRIDSDEPHPPVQKHAADGKREEVTD